jgi:hypothetical protein
MLFKSSNNLVHRVVALPRHKFVTGATLLQLNRRQFLQKVKQGLLSNIA